MLFATEALLWFTVIASVKKDDHSLELTRFVVGAYL